MGRIHRPRFGSLQFWPRKRAAKIVPTVNWKPVELKSKKQILGFLGYKVGMATILAKDLTNDSKTKEKRISIPVSIIECPPMKVFSIRFYKNKKTVFEVLAENIDKEMKRKIKLPKKKGNLENIPDYDDIRLLVYSDVKKTGLKKTPDIAEIGLKGTKEEKLNLSKSLLGKEITVSDVFDKMQLVDVRGVTVGKGRQGPIKRFGIGKKSHKTEKGVRNPGSLGPWFPHRVTFKAPQAGQTGYFTRVIYNLKLMDLGKTKEKDINLPQGFRRYGKIKSDYIIVRGSVQGPEKRVLVITHPIRPTKKQVKKNFEIIRIE